MNEFLEGYCNRAMEVNQGESMQFIISTSGIKRDGLDLNPADFVFTNYLRNPVVLWSHDLMGFENPPIGKVTSLTVEDTRILAEIVFDSADPFAERVANKYRTGFLNAVSISWNTTRGESGVQHELLEVSAVTVPADPDALIVRQQQGLKRIAHLINNTLREEGQYYPDLADVWSGVQVGMVALYQADNLDDNVRYSLHQSFSDIYRTLGKTPPDFLTNEVLHTSDLSRVFKEGEQVTVPEAETSDDYESHVLGQATMWRNMLKGDDTNE